MSTAPEPALTATAPRADWIVIIGAVFAGVVTAMQIGKASAALPALRAEFGVGLADASLYLSLFSLGAALFSTAVGILVLRIKPLRAGVIGLSLIGIGSLGGSFAAEWQTLLSARLLEACGLPLVVCAMPALIQSCCSGRARVIAMALWAMWLPLGFALAMAPPTPWETEGAWRLLFRACGVLPLAAACYLLLVTGRVRARAAALPKPQAMAARILPDGTTLAVAVLFALFSASYLVVQGFFPSLATEAWSLDLSHAARLGGFAALLVIVGNIAASVFLSLQITAARLLFLSFSVMGITAVLFFYEPLPLPIRLGAALVFITCAGVPPGVIWALVPVLSDRSGAGPAVTSGTLYQGAGIGQLSGPLLAGFAVDMTGNWGGAALVTTLCVLLALAITAGVGRHIEGT